MRLTAAVTREGKRFVAQCLELDVASQGDTIEAAVANLREAVELRLEDEPQPPSFNEPPIIVPLEVTPRPPAA
jgi:predicted RNase H-like HicB family nuclease